MSAVLEWLKTFLMLYFFLTLILYLVPKEILSEVSAICSKNDTFSGGVLPLLNRVSSGVVFFHW